MLPQAAAHVVVRDISKPEFDADDLHHLRRVLRVGANEVVTITNGSGAWRLAELNAEVLVMTGDVVHEQPRDPALAVGIPLLKGDRTELMVQKLTEIGIDHIWPLATSRGIVRWSGDKETTNLERLRRVVRQALMQSRGVWLPEVHAVTSLREFVSQTQAVMADMGGSALLSGVSAVAIGPEGGWSDEERAMSVDSVTLGATVLRAETAAIVAAGLLSGCRSGVVIPVV